MLLHQELHRALENNGNISKVLDVGCKFPYMLIEILHSFDPRICVGVELTEDHSLVSVAGFEKIITESSKLDSEIIYRLRYDSDARLEIYNAYKLYVCFTLRKTPLIKRDFERKFKLMLGISIDEYFQYDLSIDNPLHFDLIIASKVLSHLQPEGKSNKSVTLNTLLSRLSNDGIIYLRLNSEDFEAEKGPAEFSLIRDPYTIEHIHMIKSKLDILYYNEERRSSDNKMEYVIIGKPTS